MISFALRKILNVIMIVTLFSLGWFASNVFHAAKETITETSKKYIPTAPKDVKPIDIGLPSPASYPQKKLDIKQP